MSFAYAIRRLCVCNGILNIWVKQVVRSLISFAKLVEKRPDYNLPKIAVGVKKRQRSVVLLPAIVS